MKVPVEPDGRDRYWEELRAMEPRLVCERGLVSFRDGRYRIPFLDEIFVVDPDNQTVLSAGNGNETDCALLSLFYLLRARNIPIEGDWVSEKGLRGGELFFRGPHALPSENLSRIYGDDVAGFLSMAKKIGGKSVNYGDAAAEFAVLPRVPLTCILWAGDDEFPAQVNYLFDVTTSDQLPLDMVLDLVHKVARRVANSPPNC